MHRETLRRLRLPLGLTLALLFGIATVPLRAADEPEDAYARMLRDKGISPDAEGLAPFLRNITPGEQKRQLILKLIAQLGDDDFKVRETATQTLKTMPFVPEVELQNGLRSVDPEVRNRIEVILRDRKSNDQSISLVHAALRTIQRRKIHGIIPEILQVVPIIRQDHILLAVRDAMIAAAGPDDVALIRKAAASEDVEIRAVAVPALGAALGQKAAADLRGFLDDKSPRVQLAAAVALANMGDRSCLVPLGQMLASDEMPVRQSAVATLRSLTGKAFPFLAYESPTSQKAAVTAWQDWIKANGQTAQLNFPLKPVRTELGRTLICLYSNSRVVELDARGKQVWEANVQLPWSCQGLPNGNRLIVSYSGRAIVEFDDAGKEVWRQTVNFLPTSAERLDNGNTLISNGTVVGGALANPGGKILEMRPDGQIAWEAAVQGRVTSAHRLENGLTLATVVNGVNGKVVEVDRDGKEVWAIENLRAPQSVQRLDNGNTLIAQGIEPRVAEYDRAGKVVWSLQGLNVSVLCAQRLENGNTLVSGSGGLIEYDPRGGKVWEYDRNNQGGTIRGICRY